MTETEYKNGEQWTEYGGGDYGCGGCTVNPGSIECQGCIYHYPVGTQNVINRRRPLKHYYKEPYSPGARKEEVWVTKTKSNKK